MPDEVLEREEKTAGSRAANRLVLRDWNNAEDATEDGVLSLDRDESGGEDHKISDVSDENHNQGDMQDNQDWNASEQAAQHSTVPALYPDTEATTRLVMKKKKARHIKLGPNGYEPTEYCADECNGDEGWKSEAEDHPADKEGRSNGDADLD